ncbi:hypothetical protein ABVK25_012533 [Lepraria finkii]|uniref:Uncharacterized protein n=1 Tax=Lepraria finkii TaxID=1340010 RepID=A0ABR4AF18_9LECA
MTPQPPPNSIESSSSPNSNYKRSGTKSYVFLMKKYRFSPTMEGPYTSSNVAHDQGKFGPQNAIGGRDHHASCPSQEEAPPSRHQHQQGNWHQWG